MAKPSYHSFFSSSFLFIFTIFFSIYHSGQLQSPQSQSLFQIWHLLNYPESLSSLSQATNICNVEPSPSLTLVCYEDNVTQIHINGAENLASPLPHNFSSSLFFSTLSALKTLKVLSLVNLGFFGPLPTDVSSISTLEILNISSNFFSGEIPKSISSLSHLQTLILDNNNFSGPLPVWLSSLPELTVLSLRNNFLTGFLPASLSSLHNLRVLSLSSNNLSGEVPDFHSLTNLQVLDLGGNRFGPHFPKLHTKLVTLVLRENKFSFNLPTNLSSFYQLRELDISSNRFVGPFLLPLFSLPLLRSIDISRNKFTGMLSENTSCGSELVFVNFSSNRFRGKLPSCLKSNRGEMVVYYGGNCLSERGRGDQQQHRYSFCHNEALAVNVNGGKREKRSTHDRKGILSSSLVGGIFGGFLIFGVIFFVIRRLQVKHRHKSPLTRLITEKVPPADTIRMLSDARYISETMKLGAHGLPPYRTFSLDELKEATGNFCESNLIGEGSQGKVYRGSIADGTLVAVGSLKMRKRNRVQYYRQQIELVSKLRHRHLVSSVGHCFECYSDDSSVSTIFLVFEFVPNGTLRSCISEGLGGHKFTWKQRIAAAIGVASGIQFLHTGIVPGVFSNKLKITDVLLDNDLNVKISNYNLPLFADGRRQVGIRASPNELKERNGALHVDKDDIYDLGVILLEIIVGRAITSESDVSVAKDLLRVSLQTDDVARRSIMDPVVHKECSDESVKTVIGICLRCLSKEPTERPSIEDVLWNLQYAAQVQVHSRTSNQGSPVMSPNPK